MQFRYLRDPLFLFAFGLYWLNRLVLKPNFETPFLHNHLNDLICIPFLVPIMLWVMRSLRLRSHDDPPLAHEVVIPLIVWSILFEIVFPGSPFWSKWVVGDPNDIIWYTLGAAGSMSFWRNWDQVACPERERTTIYE